MFGKLAAAAGAVMAGSIVMAIATDGDEKFIVAAVIAGVLMMAFAGAEWYTSRGVKGAIMEGGVDTGGGDIRESNVAGRDQTINYAQPPKAVVLDGWEDEPGAPKFRLNVAATRLENGVRQEMGFYKQKGGPVGGVRARFRGPGVSMEMVTPREREADHWQMQEVVFSADGTPDPELGDGVAGFEVQFKWEGAERHILWSAKFSKHEGRSHWDIDWRVDPDQFWTV